MPIYCYRFDGDKHTHYGPFEAGDFADLVKRLEKYNHPRRLEGMTFWEISDPKEHVYPPKPGEKNIYVYEHGRFFLKEKSLL